MNPIIAGTREFDAMVMQWQDVKKQADELAKLEKELRAQILGIAFSDKAQAIGTFTHQLGAGWSLKKTASLAYKLDNKAGATYQAIEELAQLNKELASTIVNWQPKLNVAQYKELPNGSPEKRIIDRVLTTTSGSPTLALEGPK